MHSPDNTFYLKKCWDFHSSTGVNLYRVRASVNPSTTEKPKQCVGYFNIVTVHVIHDWLINNSKFPEFSKE